MAVLTVFNLFILVLIVHKVKQLEKDVESLQTSVSAITKVLRGAFIRKKTRL